MSNIDRVNRSVGQHHGDLRRALIAAALELLGDGRVDDVTLRGVARRAGVSAAAPYHHFLDRDAMLAAVAHDGFESLAMVQLEVLERAGDPVDRLERLAIGYVHFAWANHTHYSLMFKMLQSDATGPDADALRESAGRSLGRLVSAIQSANPDLDHDESFGRSLLAWSLAHGATDVGQWSHALRAGFQPASFAAEVGREITRLALASPERQAFRNTMSAESPAAAES